MEPEDTSELAPAKGRWFRFSILTIILLSVIVCLIISHVRMMNEVAQAEADLAAAEAVIEDRRLLYKTDDGKLHVVAFDSFGEDRQWSLALPVKPSYRLCVKVNDVPSKGIPDNPTLVSKLEQGTTWFSMGIDHMPKGDWYLVVTNRWKNTNASGVRVVGERIPEDSMWWNQFNKRYVKTPLAHYTTRDPADGPRFNMKNSADFFLEPKSFDPGETIVLVRNRVMKYNDQFEFANPDAPTEGVMVWLEPVPDPDSKE